MALKDVSFRMLRGESVGVLGLNGSGKSTLLQIIAGTMVPNTGNVHVSGKVASILELGSGFNPNFTGIENIYLNAGLHGFTEDKTKEILSEIEEFAGIGEYIYQPVRTYSSGMVVRLGYAIIANLHPDLLLVDEALAVGDFLFQQKCISSMRDLQKSGTGILFVSHSLNLISEFCDKILILDNGNQLFFGNLKEGIFLYEKKLLEEREKKSKNYIESHSVTGVNRNGRSNLNSYVQLIDFEICDKDKISIGLIETGKILILKLTILFKKDFVDPHCGFKLVDETGKTSFGINTFSLNFFCGSISTGEKVSFEFKLKQRLQAGKYSVNIGIADGGFGSKTKNFHNPLGYIQTNNVFEVVTNECNFTWSGPVFMDTDVRSYR